MSNLELFFWFYVGILLSLFVPIAVKWLHEFREQTSKGGGDLLVKVWHFTKPILKVGVGSAILGFILLAILLATNVKITTWYAAMIVGYSWDSTLQKFSIAL
jgi:hypothetical protein